LALRHEQIRDILMALAEDEYELYLVCDLQPDGADGDVLGGTFVDEPVTDDFNWHRRKVTVYIPEVHASQPVLRFYGEDNDVLLHEVILAITNEEGLTRMAKEVRSTLAATDEIVFCVRVSRSEGFVVEDICSALPTE
jgi:hypothetical protein